MAWHPDAIRKPVERYQPGGSVHTPMAAARRLCFHTAVSSGDSLFGLFNTPGNAVAHFYVRDDGKIEQYVNTDTRASANLEGNHDTISVESWDAGGMFRKWTDRQVEACAHLAAWVHKTHGIPLKACDASPGSRGITWHRKGIDGNFPAGLLSGRKAGDEHWSNSTGKICPFDGKIHGIVDDIIPRARQIVEGDWFDMATKEDLREVVNNALAGFREEIRATVDKALADASQRQADKTAAAVRTEDIYPKDDTRKVTIGQALGKLLDNTTPEDTT